MYYVYALKSKNGNHYYTGQTNNLRRRLKEHNSGNTYWTKRYRPWKIIYTECFKNREEAIRKEKYFKSHAGRTWLKINITPS